MEVRVLEFSWNKFQTCQLGNFSITSFKGCFRPWHFSETMERPHYTCVTNFQFCFAILSETCPVDVRVPKWSWNKFQTSHIATFTITYFMECFRTWNFIETWDRSWRTCGTNFIFHFSIFVEISPMNIRVLECS